jgi:hypothetical protein
VQGLSVPDPRPARPGGAASERYWLGDSPPEVEHLLTQAKVYAPEAEELLDRIGLRPGASAIDIGRGTLGRIRRGDHDQRWSRSATVVPERRRTELSWFQDAAQRGAQVGYHLLRPTIRIARAAPLACLGNWLPLAEAATREPVSVTAYALPTMTSVVGW